MMQGWNPWTIGLLGQMAAPQMVNSGVLGAFGQMGAPVLHPAAAQDALAQQQLPAAPGAPMGPTPSPPQVIAPQPKPAAPTGAAPGAAAQALMGPAAAPAAKPAAPRAPMIADLTPDGHMASAKAQMGAAGQMDAYASMSPEERVKASQDEAFSAFKGRARAYRQSVQPGDAPGQGAPSFMSRLGEAASGMSEAFDPDTMDRLAMFARMLDAGEARWLSDPRINNTGWAAAGQAAQEYQASVEGREERENEKAWRDEQRDWARQQQGWAAEDRPQEQRLRELQVRQAEAEAEAYQRGLDSYEALLASAQEAGDTQRADMLRALGPDGVGQMYLMEAQQAFAAEQSALDRQSQQRIAGQRLRSEAAAMGRSPNWAPPSGRDMMIFEDYERAFRSGHDAIRSLRRARSLLQEMADRGGLSRGFDAAAIQRFNRFIQEDKEGRALYEQLTGELWPVVLQNLDGLAPVTEVELKLAIDRTPNPDWTPAGAINAIDEMILRAEQGVAVAGEGMDWISRNGSYASGRGADGRGWHDTLGGLYQQYGLTEDGREAPQPVWGEERVTRGGVPYRPYIGGQAQGQGGASPAQQPQRSASAPSLASPPRGAPPAQMTAAQVRAGGGPDLDSLRNGDIINLGGVRYRVNRGFGGAHVVRVD